MAKFLSCPVESIGRQNEYDSKTKKLLLGIQETLSEKEKNSC